MSETPGTYHTGNKSFEEKTKLNFIAKKLTDFTKDLEKLSEEDKKYIIEKADEVHGCGLVDLYNSLGEYMK